MTPRGLGPPPQRSLDLKRIEEAGPLEGRPRGPFRVEWVSVPAGSAVPTFKVSGRLTRSALRARKVSEGGGFTLEPPVDVPGGVPVTLDAPGLSHAVAFGRPLTPDEALLAQDALRDLP